MIKTYTARFIQSPKKSQCIWFGGFSWVGSAILLALVSRGEPLFFRDRNKVFENVLSVK